MSEPRSYRDEGDLQAMHALLRAGRKAENGSYYVHTGDLSWWLYYPPLEGDYWEDIYLWDDPDLPRRLLGWALISTHWVGMDLYVQPELRGGRLAREMLNWTEQRAIRAAHEMGKTTVYMLWVSHGDEVLGALLKEKGYRLGKGYVHLTRNLDGKIQENTTSPGFIVRGCKGEPEVPLRAKAQYGAFGSQAPFERYVERFRNFMRSPVYQPVHDIVAMTGDGQIGAFCLMWTDPLTAVGLFEPVGTHPDFQHMGLGRAVMLEGLRRMKRAGMKTAIVSTFEDNLAAIKLYESVGFRIVNRLGTYEKDV